MRIRGKESQNWTNDVGLWRPKSGGTFESNRMPVDGRKSKRPFEGGVVADAKTIGATVYCAGSYAR